MTDRHDPASDVLPSPRGLPYRIGIVCLGNICRSPTAEVVLRARIEEAGLADRVEVSSAGTGDWHLGEPMDRRAAAVLVAAGLDPSGHRARQIGPDGADWFEGAESDLLLVMDDANLRDVLALGVPEDRVRMFRAFDPLAADDREVPDPWSGGPEGFDEVLTIVQRTARTLTAALAELLV